MASIEPTLPGGFRDYLSQEMSRRQQMIDSIRTTFGLFGFSQIDTPGVERAEVLTGGDPEFKKQMYHVSHQEGESGDLALRFDLTVPLARVFAANNSDIKRPFKRYQIGRVWRGERQQAGRYREFTQCDADIVGTENNNADAEIIALVYSTFKNLNVGSIQIKINNRKILNGLSAYAGFDASKTDAVIRIIDKYDKIGWKAVTEELKSGASLTDTQIDAIQQLVTMPRGEAGEMIQSAKTLLAKSEVAKEGLAELEQVVAQITNLNVPASSYVIDFSVARGLGYYTGTIYETTLLDAPEFGSVCSGGRYDNLIERFGGVRVGAVGVSIGIDRLFTAVQKLTPRSTVIPTTKVMVLNFDEKCIKEVSAITTELRNATIATDLYCGMETNLKGQLAYAVSMNVPVVIMVGSNEKEKGVVLVKNMIARTQTEVFKDAIVEAVRGIIQ